VPAPGDYDEGEIGGMMIDKGNQSTLRKPAPGAALSTINLTWLPGREPGPTLWEAILSYCSAVLWTKSKTPVILTTFFTFTFLCALEVIQLVKLSCYAE
jgi:hypothetical protein